jgi:lia operon protein LiaG
MKKIVSALLLMLGIGLVGTLVSVSASGGFSFETYEIKDELVIENKDVEDLNFHFASSDIEVVPTTDENITVELEGKISKKLKEKVSLVAEENGGQVNVTLLDKNQKVFNIGILIYDTNIRIHVPEKEYHSTTIATESGDIRTEGILAKKLTVKANSGDVRVKTSEGRESFEVATSSGDITVEQVKSEKLTLASSSGDVYLKGSQAESTRTVASSGDVEISKASGNIETITSSGDISFSNQQPTGHIIAKSSSGDVMIEFKEKPASLELDYKGESGTGMIDLKGMSFLEKEEDRMIGQIGDGKYKLNVITNSGDFHLK